MRDKELILAPEDDPHIASELKTQGAELEKKGAGPKKKKAGPAKQKAKLKEQEAELEEEVAELEEEKPDLREQGIEEPKGSSLSEGDPEESEHKKSRLEPLVDDKD